MKKLTIMEKILIWNNFLILTRVLHQYPDFGAICGLDLIQKRKKGTIWGYETLSAHIVDAFGVRCLFGDGPAVACGLCRYEASA